MVSLFIFSLLVKTLFGIVIAEGVCLILSKTEKESRHKARCSGCGSPFHRTERTGISGGSDSGFYRLRLFFPPDGELYSYLFGTRWN